MRVFGEPASLLDRAGLDVDHLDRLERAVADHGGLPGAPRADVHAHLGRDLDGHVLESAALLADMDRWDVSRAVIFALNDPGTDGGFTAANDLVCAAAARHPSRLVPFCRVDPAAGWEAAIARAAARGARGLKLHPVAQHFAPESPAAVACIRAATARGWPVIIHAGFGARALAGPLGEALGAVPGARLILAHGARGDARAVRAALGAHPGVWFDTSLAALSDLVELAPERLLFGSDRPYGDYATALQLVGAAARIAGWTDAQTRGVLGGNFAALVGD